MSSYYIRNLAEQWAVAIGTLPYYPIINESPDPLDDIWLAMDFDSYGATKESYCNDFVEEGEINLIFMGRVGIGYETLLLAAETFADSFMGSTDANGYLVLTQSNPPADFAGDGDPWFVIEIAVEYEYRH